MRNLLILVVSSISLSSISAQNSNVLFGERIIDTLETNLYFDRDGILYPSFYISNESLKNCHSSLLEFYRQHTDKFKEIADQNACSFENFSNENCMILNDTLISKFVRNLNKNKPSTVSFFIHGFRKQFASVNKDKDSKFDYLLLNKAYLNAGDSTSAIVNVYWDAMYGCCFGKDTKNNTYLFQLFEQAQKNAEKVAVTFNKVITKVKSDRINLITHSLGARVAIFSLLDINEKGIQTPSNKEVNLYFIAPAIESELITNNYLKRSSWDKQDNYSLFIAYNENDFALKKKDNKLGILGPGPYKYGNTTLGCNYRNSAKKLEKLFHNQFTTSKIKLFDLSFIGKCHHVSCYCEGENLKSMFEK